MKILVTGGAGYIGSVVVRQMLDAGHTVVVFDNLSNGHKEAVDSRAQLIHGDLLDNASVNSALKDNAVEAIVHFAGVISMKESMEKPDKYFRVNTTGSIDLFKAAHSHGIKYVIFSSTAGVYGNPETTPIPEDHPKNPTNPYGESKLMVERILRWYDEIHGMKSVCLRYFNASGASLDCVLGERHKDESHIIPLAIQSIFAGKPFTIFGTDYDTPDGTCLRDYIHIEDLADAHVKALESLVAGRPTTVYNVGTGKGYSNREIVNKIQEVSGQSINVVEGPRRPGDANVLVADPNRINSELGWSPKHSDLTTIVKTAWDFHNKHQ